MAKTSSNGGSSNAIGLAIGTDVSASPSSSGYVTASNLSATTRFHPPADTGATQTGSVFQGSGVPNNANGSNGDVYFRTDTPGTNLQRIYVKSSGAWIGIL